MTAAEQEWIEPHDKIGTFGGIYCLGRKLGSGSFGHVYIAVNTTTGQEFAAKLESAGTKNQMIPYEAKLLRRLQGATGFPALRYCNMEGDYNVMVMDLLGPSLKDLFYMCYQKFSVKTVCMLADQLLCRIQYLHSKGFLHRDIKPENFLADWGRKASTVYLIDFGLAKRYRSSKTQQHIPYADNKSLTGTARYASINAHAGLEQSRRDDCLAIGYVLIYFVQGQLPWQQLQADTKEEKYRKIMEAKKATPLEELCKGLPEFFVQYMRQCQELRFEDKPDYSYLRHLFKDSFADNDMVNDGVFDWMKPEIDKERTPPKAPKPTKTHATQAAAEITQVNSKRSSVQTSEVGNRTSLHKRLASIFSESTMHTERKGGSTYSSYSSAGNKETGSHRGSRRSGGPSKTPVAAEQSRRSGGILASIFRCGTKSCTNSK